PHVDFLSAGAYTYASVGSSIASPRSAPTVSDVTPSKRRVVILGAAGRDFHNFNVVYRDDPAFRPPRPPHRAGGRAAPAPACYASPRRGRPAHGGHPGRR